MVVALGSISQKVLQRVLPRYKGYQWQLLTTIHLPAGNFEVDEVPPPPNPGKEKRWGRTGDQWSVLID